MIPMTDDDPHSPRPHNPSAPESVAQGSRDVTELLLRWNSGHKEALDDLMPLVSGELRRLAQAYLRDESRAQTLQPTALVNELYLRLIDRRRVSWENRAHFFGFAATTMRRILVDHARSLQSAKRGGGQRPVSIEAALGLAIAQDVDVLRLDEALKTLAKLDPRQARLVELRFFVGLSIEETAEVLDIGRATVGRDWVTAKAWLHRELSKT